MCFATLSKSLDFSRCGLRFCRTTLENPRAAALDVAAPTSPPLPSANYRTPEHRLHGLGERTRLDERWLLFTLPFSLQAYQVTCLFRDAEHSVWRNTLKLTTSIHVPLHQTSNCSKATCKKAGEQELVPVCLTSS